jgi:hypothetical protein
MLFEMPSTLPISAKLRPARRRRRTRASTFRSRFALGRPSRHGFGEKFGVSEEDFLKGVFKNLT